MSLQFDLKKNIKPQFWFGWRLLWYNCCL